MFENFFRKKVEEPKKLAEPSFEEVARALPENERAELMKLKGVPEEIATEEGEHGIVIDHAAISEADEKLYERYNTLLKKAKNFYEKKNQSGG